MNLKSTYVYTDKDAVEGGHLIKLGGVDRVTNDVWVFIETHLPKNVPLRWPMTTQQAAVYPYLPVPAAKVISLCDGIVQKYAVIATDIFVHKKDMWHATIDHTNDTILGIRPGVQGMRNIWLVPNDNGGVTLLFPEEY